MASTMAKKIVRRMSAEPSEQHKLTWSLMKMLEEGGTDAGRTCPVDDVVEQLESVFPKEHAVMMEVRQVLNSMRGKV